MAKTVKYLIYYFIFNKYLQLSTSPDSDLKKIKNVYFQKKLQAILSQKPDETGAAANGEVFDPDAYLRNVEQFEDVEVVIQGRNSVRVDRKQVGSN
jgi:hypothetical protein